MGCCGGSGKNTSIKTTSAKIATQSLPGAQDGMVLIEYIGTSMGAQTWYGPVSGARYPFGLTRKYGNVDVRDLRTGSARKPGFLELRENGQDIFKIFTPPKQVAQVEVPEPVITVDRVNVDFTDLNGIGPSTAEKLISAGYATPYDLPNNIDAQELADKTGLSIKKAEAILAAWIEFKDSLE